MTPFFRQVETDRLLNLSPVFLVAYSKCSLFIYILNPLQFHNFDNRDSKNTKTSHKKTNLNLAFP